MRHRVARTATLFSILLACCACALALDPHQALDQLYRTTWTGKEGINGDVPVLAQTRDGYLWVGTSDGLLRFDGVSFEQFRPENGALTGMWVSALMAVPDGGLWVGFLRGGVSFIENGHVTNYSDADGLPVSTVRCFARDSSGVIWVAAMGGLARLAGQHWERKYSEWNYLTKSARSLTVDHEGTLWVATGNQIVFLPKGEKRFQDSGIRTGAVESITESPDGTILFYDDAIEKLRSFYRDKAGKIVTLPDTNIFAHSLVYDRDGGMWIAGKGLNRIPFPAGLHGSRLIQAAESLTGVGGLSNEDVEAVLEDHEGNIWVSSNGRLDRFRERNLRWFPLPAMAFFSLMTGPTGSAWASSMDEKRLVQVQDQKPLSDGPFYARTFYRDPDHSAWYGANSSLLHWENGRFVKVPLPDQVLKLSRSVTPPDPIIASAITKDRSGALWVAFGGSGEFRFKDGVWNFVPILTDHPDWSAHYAFTDDADRIWLCWGDRIARYDHGSVQVFGTKEGLAIGSPNLIAESDHEIWVGGDSGLSRFQAGRFRTIQGAGGSRFTQINGIVAVPNAGIWLSTGRGIVHIPESEVQRAIRDPEHEPEFEAFDLISDLPEPIHRTAETYSSAAFQTDDGMIWFTAKNGAVRVDPAHIHRNPVPPPVVIRSVSADEKGYSPSGNLRLPALTKNVKIDYAALSLSIPERVRFRYQLEPLENEWQEAEGRREAIFTRLAPGRYLFRVIARNNDGVWNETGASLEFSVLPAFYQTIWFRALCVMVLMAMAWGIYQLRVQQLQRQFAIRLGERTRIARELHDTLLQNLHGLMFQFQAARNLMSRKPEEAMHSLDSAIEETERAIDESQHAIQGLRSEAMAKGKLAELLRSTSRELANTGRPDQEPPAVEVIEEGNRQALASNTRNDVCRIAVEILRNAYRHAQAHRIEAEIRYDDRMLRLRIRDDGKGIDAKVLKEGGRAGHWGLGGMRERAKSLGAQLDIWSEPGLGTEVQLSVPAAVAYETTRKDVGSKWLRKVRTLGQRS